MASDFGVITVVDRNMTTPHDYYYIHDPKTFAYEKLEMNRLCRLGLYNRYSRHYNLRRKNTRNEDRGRGYPCVTRPTELFQVS